MNIVTHLTVSEPNTLPAKWDKEFARRVSLFKHLAIYDQRRTDFYLKSLANKTLVSLGEKRKFKENGVDRLPILERIPIFKKESNSEFGRQT